MVRVIYVQEQYTQVHNTGVGPSWVVSASGCLRHSLGVASFYLLLWPKCSSTDTAAGSVVSLGAYVAIRAWDSWLDVTRTHTIRFEGAKAPVRGS